MKRKGNILAAITCFLWSGVFLLGRDLLYHVYEKGPGVFPSAGQIEFGMVYPIAMAAMVGGSAWIANAFQRWFNVLAVIASIALIALLPFMLAYGGGV